MEREVEHQPRGLGAETLTAALADRDPELGPAVGVDNLKQTDVAARVEPVRA